MVFALLSVFAACASSFGVTVADNGFVCRTIDCSDGHVCGASYGLVGSSMLMRAGSPEFSLLVDGRRWSGCDTWSDIRTSVQESGGGRETRVSFLATNGSFRIGLAYMTYPGLPLVRKTLEVTNLGDADIRVEAVNVEDFRLAFDATKSQTYRNYARYRALGSYAGDWDDPLMIVHNTKGGGCGIAVGNEAVGVLKRTSVFEDGLSLRAGVTSPEQPYPFRRWLKKGGVWRSAAVFTVPYTGTRDPHQAVDATVQDYVRRHMGVRIEQIVRKPMFVYNTWDPFRQNVNEGLVLEVAEAAAECGVEEFVIDDGWQVNVAQLENRPKTAQAPRGDWVVDPGKFPRGLKPVFDRIRQLGMKPGLWVSLACVDSQSRPYREHPDWLVRDGEGRPANLHGGGLSTATACMGTGWYGHIRDTILRLVRECGLAYVKLDLAAVTSAYVYDSSLSGCRACGHSGHRDWAESLDVIYARCMDLFDELHRESPELFIDCTFETAGKLQLMDYGIAKHAEGNWLSNIGEAEPYGSLIMRGYAWGRCPALPAASLVIGNLRMDDPDHLLAFKSLAGTLPIMLGDPRKLSVAERAEYKAFAGWLKGLEARHGFMSFRQDLPGFGEPAEGRWDGFSRINTETKSGGLVGVFRQGAAEDSRRVVVPGLDPAVRYEIRRAPTGETVAAQTGEELAERGFEVSLPARHDGALYELSVRGGAR